MKYRGLLFLFIVLFTLNSSIRGTNNLEQDNKIEFDNRIDKTNLGDQINHLLTESSPIIIIHDDNFTDYGFDGNGSADNPYIIENLNITTTEKIGISISYTSKYFIIRNCFVQTSLAANHYGIYINGTSYGTARINNNILMGNGIGILLDVCDSTIVHNNTLINNVGYGIFINLVNDMVLYFNDFMNNGGETSQGYDKGSNNTWFHENLEQGNFWNDWDSVGTYAIDGDANTEDLYPSSIPYMDNNPPEISNINYTPEMPNEHDIIHITTTVTDNYEVQQVSLYYRVNDAQWLNNSMVANNSVYSTSIGTFEIGDTINFYITAADIAYNAENSSVFVFNVTDNSAPLISEINFTPEMPNEYEIIHITATITDNHAVQQVSLYYQVNDAQWLNNSMVANNSVYSTSIGPFEIGDTINFYITASDTANNNVLSEITSFIVIDGTKPVISNVNYSPTNITSQDEITITCIVTDNVAVNMVFLYYRINEDTWNNVTMNVIAGSTYSATVGVFEDGTTVSFYVSAIDTTLNIETSSIYSFTINDETYDDPTWIWLSTPGSIITISILALLLMIILFSTIIIVNRGKSKMKRVKKVIKEVQDI